MDGKREKLIRLYQEMAEHTAPECKACFIPHSCCNSIYCDLAIRLAKSKWSIDLPTTDNPTLPLMGPTGCTAAPHLRPICTVHTCAVNSLGSKPGDRAWTEKYYDLREQVDALEFELFPLQL